MKRFVSPFLVLLGLSGCISIESGPEGGFAPGGFGGAYRQPGVPGVMGPQGQNIPLAAPYNNAPPASEMQAKYMMSQSMPLTDVQMHSPNSMMQAGMTAPGALPPRTLMPGNFLSPPGVPPMPGAPGGMTPPFPPNMGGGGGMPSFPPNMGGGNGLMPAAGSGRSGGGLMQASYNPAGGEGDENVAQASFPPALVAAMGTMPQGDGVRFSVLRTQVRFMRPSGMKVAWFTRGPDGQPTYSSTPIEAPGRYNFQQGAVYRLKLSNIEGRPGLEVYPTLEVVPVNPKTEAFLAHSSVPVDFSDEDFNQITQGNFVVKVIYLPDQQYQEFAGTGVDQILSTQLEPGADPVKEALRRGNILLVVRMGNVDQEAPNTPPLGATSASNLNNYNVGAYAPPNGMLSPPMVPYVLPQMPPPGCLPPGFGMPATLPPPQPQKQNEADKQEVFAPNAAAPFLTPPPSNAMVRPPANTPNTFAGPGEPMKLPDAANTMPPKETPGSLTGRRGTPEPPPEVGPPPTALPESGVPGTGLLSPSRPATSNARPEPKLPDELLQTMPPTGAPLPPPATTTPPAIDLPPGITLPAPPPSASNDGPPTMLPLTDPGQPVELQRTGAPVRN